VTDRESVMRVDTNSLISSAPIIQNTTSRPKATVGSDKLDVAQTDALVVALKATAEVRPEAVERAKALIQDPSYPSAKVLDQVAKLLTKSIRRRE
jgi:hypothetical protein